MSRPSASATPFLVLRPETGKCAYWRNLRSEIAPSVKGLVFASWLLKPHHLMGKAVVKISLKTGDKQLAQRRWLDIHTQVETLVDAATTQAASALVPATPSARPGLTSGDRAAIAAQARHDVLAQHDEALVDQTSMSPLARGLAAALRARDAGRLPTSASPGGFEDRLSAHLATFPQNMSPDAIREWAHQKEAEHFADMLKTGNFSVIDGPPAILDEVAPDPANRYRPKVISTQMFRELDLRLAENGLVMDDKSERRRLAVAITRAKAAAHQDIDSRSAGKSVETPPRPAPLVAEANGKAPLTLLEMHTKWVERKATPREIGGRQQGLR